MPRIFFSRPSSLRATARRMKEGGSDLRYFSLLNDQRQSESISLEVRDFFPPTFSSLHDIGCTEENATFELEGNIMDPQRRALLIDE